MDYTPKFEDIQRIREKNRYAECDHIAAHVDSAMNSEDIMYSHPDHYQWAGGDVVEAYVRKRVASASRPCGLWGRGLSVSRNVRHPWLEQKNWRVNNHGYPEWGEGITHSGSCWKRHKRCHRERVMAFKGGMDYAEVAATYAMNKPDVEEMIRVWMVLWNGRKSCKP